MSALFDTKNDRDLLWGNDAHTADYLGISKKQVARYKAHPDKMPHTVRRLLMLRFGDLSGLLGTEWDGFTFRQGELFHPFYKCGFTAAEVKGWFFGRQELNHLRGEVPRLLAQVAALKLELEKQKETAWAADKLAGLFRPSDYPPRAAPALRPTPPPCGTLAGTPPVPMRRSGT